MSISAMKNNHNAPERDITLYLSDFWRGFVKFWWLGAVLALLLGAIQFYRSYVRFSPSYQVSAAFTVHMEDHVLSGDGGMSPYSFSYNRTTAGQPAMVFSYVMQSEILQERVCKDLGVSCMPASVSVSCVSGTNMIKITATGSDPQKTYDVLMSVIKNYPYVTEYIIGPTKLVMISSPEVPTEPCNGPVWKNATLKGVLAGLLIGAVWIVLYAILRQTVRTKEDVQRELNQTCIGVLPQVTFQGYDHKVNTDILLTNPMVGHDFPEALHLLGSTVQNSLWEGEKVILITSTAPGEGKSITALNLASVFAQNGRKVLVVDGDLRSSGISRMLFPDAPAQADENDSLYDIIYVEPLAISVLKFPGAQKQLREMMRADRLKEVMAAVREQYDLILIDTPPCGVIADAAVLASAADTALYIVRQDTVLSACIREGINTMLSTDVRFAGCILNGALGGLGGYGSHYRCGGYHRDYRYGRPGKSGTERG